jgi:hypothetical protein
LSSVFWKIAPIAVATLEDPEIRKRIVRYQRLLTEKIMADRMSDRTVATESGFHQGGR